MLRILTKVSFLSGVVIGILLAVLLKLQTTKETNKNISGAFNTLNYDKWFKQNRLQRLHIPFDLLRYGNKSYFPEASYLYKNIPILCVVLVKSSKNSKAAFDTWGRHCNEFKTVIVKSEQRKVPIKRTNNESSWALLCKTIKDVPEEYKWIVIVYDYTFVITENLRFFVAALNSQENFYLGHSIKYWDTVYNMGEAGYVISRGVVNSFKNAYANPEFCVKRVAYMNKEDFYLGKYLAALNITPIDTRDENGLSTFSPENLNNVFSSGGKDISIYTHKGCSDYRITFQAIEGDKMYRYYYFIYTVQLFGYGNFGNRPALKRFNDSHVWKSFLRERNISEHITAEQYYKIWENLVDEPTSFARHMKREEYFDYQ